MESEDPPSYAEVTKLERPKILNHPNWIDGESNFCKYCGAGVTGGKYCSNGQIYWLW